MTEHTPADHSFIWWLCMLPFLAAMGVFIYRWLHNQGQVELLGYAVGSLVVGIVFSAFIAGSSHPAEEGNKGDENGGSQS